MKTIDNSNDNNNVKDEPRGAAPELSMSAGRASGSASWREEGWMCEEHKLRWGHLVNKQWTPSIITEAMLGWDDEPYL